MKHEAPKVEDYSEGDATPNPPPIGKRKHEKIQEQTPETETDTQKPPSKASKSSNAPTKDEQDAESESEYVDEDGAEDGEGEEEEGEEEEGEEEEEDEQGEENEHTIDEPKAHKVIEEFGRAPLDRTPLAEKPLTAAPETVLAMVIDALLKSRPISHDLSQRAVNKIVEVGYHEIQTLGKSSWEERTMVLKDGGYNRYREQGATNLGDLAELVDGKYDGDLNNLLEKAGHNRDKARSLIKEIKGLGDLGVDLFFNNVQSVWPSMAPFVDARSLQTAGEVGIGTDLDTVYAELKKDPLEMSKFANGLSMVRLEKKKGDIEEA